MRADMCNSERCLTLRDGSMNGRGVPEDESQDFGWQVFCSCLQLVPPTKESRLLSVGLAYQPQLVLDIQLHLFCALLQWLQVTRVDSRVRRYGRGHGFL